MKHSFHVRGFLFFLVITSMFFLQTTRASHPHAAPTQGGVGLDGFKQTGPSTEMETESFWDLMGAEECDDERDEECLKRRVISEAHLDYIYTQQHNP